MSSPGNHAQTAGSTGPGQRGPVSHRASLASGETIAEFLLRENLFAVDEAGIARLPVLIGGALWVPGLPTPQEIEAALDSKSPSVEIGDTHIIAVAGQLAGRPLRALAVPRVTDPLALIPSDIDAQVRNLHCIEFTAIARHVDAIGAALSLDGAIAARALPLAVACSEQPEYYVRLGFQDVHAAFDGHALGVAVDRELCYDAHPGRDFLDGWVEIDDVPTPGAMAVAGAGHDGIAARTPAKRRLRAVPMSQLHITAGNSPVVPAISALRALATKAPMTVKLPSGALVAGSAFAVAVWAAGPNHPLVRHASIAYWRGGDEIIEESLFRASAFQRIVVWGSRESVESVTRRAGGTKTLVFNPRYGLSLIGRGALAPNSVERTVRLAAQDVMVWNQQACIASLVHYVEGTGEEIDRYCSELTRELRLWDEEHHPTPSRAMIGRVRSARRAELSVGKWHFNGPPVAPTSAVVRMDRGFDLSAHPQARVVVVRPVGDIAEALPLLHAGVSSVGIAPLDRLDDLRDAICGRGVTAVLPLGEADTLFTGAPHDGMRALSELVSWAVA